MSTDQKTKPGWLKRLVRPLSQWFNAFGTECAASIKANAWRLLVFRNKLLILRNKTRIFQLECSIFIRLFFKRAIFASHFLMHRKYRTLYFHVRGIPLYKPQYSFKMFDKLHSVLWPNS